MDWAHYLSLAIGFALFGIVYFFVVFLACHPNHALHRPKRLVEFAVYSLGQLDYGFSPTRDGQRSIRPKIEWPVLDLRVAYSGQYRVSGYRPNFEPFVLI